MASASATSPRTSSTCDRCRRHKARCDGLRPICGHCVAASKDCAYSTGLDGSVMIRLADVEHRLASLESSSRAVPSRAAAEAAAAASIWSTALSRPPVLHTAAGHHMLYSWPKLKAVLNMEKADSLRFLEEADQADPFLRDAPDTLRVWQLIRSTVDFYNEMSGLPAVIIHLLDLYPDLFGKDAVLGDLRSRDEEALVDVPSFAPTQLIVYAMALWAYGGFLEGAQLDCEGSSVTSGISAASRAASGCLKAALEKQWTVMTKVKDRVALVLALGHAMVYYWARPWHALGLLQGLATVLRRWSLRTPDDELLLSCCNIYLILESDILTEIDEYGTDTILADGSNIASDIIKLAQRTQANDDGPLVMAYVDGHAWLRGQMNQILHLYAPNKAYEKPEDLADLVARHSSELQAWYYSLPVERRFPRDATTFSMTNELLPLHTKELAIRYFSCLFFLHRPLLSMHIHSGSSDPSSDAVQSSTTTTAAVHDSSSTTIAPWILESSRICIESAALIIQLCGTGFANNLKRTARSWCEYQLLFAAFLVVLQAAAVGTDKGEQLSDASVFEPVWRSVGRPDWLLDRVEGTFELGEGDAWIVGRALQVLRQVRAGFEHVST